MDLEGLMGWSSRIGSGVPRLLMFVGAMAAAAACGGSTGTTGTGGPSPVTQESMTARINGATWTAATTTIVAANVGGIITLTASETGAGSNRTIALAVVTVTTGEFIIGQPPIVSSGASIQLSQGTATWSANTDQGSGTIVITALTADRVTGTFEFEGQPVAGTSASGARSVTAGTFSADF